MAKKKSKAIVKLTGITLGLALLGTGIGLCVAHKEDVGKFFTNVGTTIKGWFVKEDPKPDENTVQVQFLIEGQDPIIKTAQKACLLGDVPEEPTKESYTFKGWALEGTTEVINFEEFIFTGDATFVAIFEETTFEIRFNMGENIVLKTTNAEGFLVDIPEAPIKEGYIFKGWAVEGTTDVIDLDTYNFGANTTLVPVYEANIPDDGIGYEQDDISMFSFSDGVITGYLGTKENLELPSSYSLGEPSFLAKHFSDGQDVLDFFDEYQGRLRIVDSQASIHNVTSAEEFMAISGDISYPVTAYYEIIPIIEGTDIVVSSIGVYAFENNTSLKNVKIPNSVVKIEDFAFHSCSSLIKVVLPSTLESIGSSAFANCSSLSDISLPDTIKSVGFKAFDYTQLSYNKIYEDDKGLYLGNEKSPFLVFCGVEDKTITNYTIAMGCKVIAGRPFRACKSLKTVFLPDTIESISPSAFLLVSSLETLTIPISVTKINVDSISNLKSLKRLEILGDIESIASSGIKDVPAMTELILHSFIVPTWEDANSISLPGDCYIYVRDELVNEYKNHENWSIYAEQIKGISELPIEEA